MIGRTHLSHSSRAHANWDAQVAVAVAILLSGLVIADRLVAWLIGEFPTSATLWQIRFEYLRPIAVFYDIVQMNLGPLSPITFSACAIVAAGVISAGVLSKVRLARALSLHGLLAGLTVLGIFSLDLSHAYAPVGFPSPTYVLLGAGLALPVLGACLQIHGEYLGWSPARSTMLRKAQITILRSIRSLRSDMVANLRRIEMQATSDQLVPVTVRRRARQPIVSRDN